MMRKSDIVIDLMAISGYAAFGFALGYLWIGGMSGGIAGVVIAIAVIFGFGILDYLR